MEENILIKFGKTQKEYEIIKKPIPHILIDSDKELHGWWKGKRECTAERLLINPYNGCSIKCRFCYANALWGYFNVYKDKGILTVFKDFDKVIAKQLDSINVASCGYLSPVTDPFQSINKEYKLSEKIIKEFIKRNLPIEFITKQQIPQEVIEDIRTQKHSFGQVSILTPNEKKRKFLAPGGATTEQLLDNIRRLSQAGIYAVCRIDPIIPLLTDDREELKELIRLVKEAGAKHIITSIMDISFKLKNYIMEYFEKLKPGINEQYKKLYTEVIDGDYNADITYRRDLFEFLKETCQENELTFALCMEYEKVGNKVIGLNRDYMTSYNCEGIDVPIYSRHGDKFYPIEDCRGNCLDCTGDSCSIDKMVQGRDLTLRDYRKWKLGENEQLKLF